MGEKITQEPIQVEVANIEGTVVLTTKQTTVGKEAFVGGMDHARRTISRRTWGWRLLGGSTLASAVLAGAFAVSNMGDGVRLHSINEQRPTAETVTAEWSDLAETYKGMITALALGVVGGLSINQTKVLDAKRKKLG